MSPSPSSRTSSLGTTLAGAYRRARGSVGFVVGVVTFCVVWVALNCATGFDPNWGIYNVVLSTEASVSTALLLMYFEKQDAASRELLESLKRLGEAQLALTREIHDSLIEARARKYEPRKSGINA